jgi:hypothetical protein
MPQSARYVNPKGKAAVFGSDPPYLFETISGTGAGDVQQSTSEPADLDGEPLEDVIIGPREVMVKFHIAGATEKELYENRQAILTLLDPYWNKNGALGRLEYTNKNGTAWIPASVKKGPQEFSCIADYFTSIPCVFYCPDSNWRGMTYNRIRLAYLGGGMRFPLRLGAVRFGARGYQATIYSLGDRPSHVEMDITGPATRPEVIKYRTGEYIRLRADKPLLEGDTLHVDTTPGQPSLTITHSNGVTEDAIGYLDLSSKLFMLDPGETLLQYVSGDDGQTSTVTVATLPWWGGR